MRELFSPSIFFVKLVSPNLSKVEARKKTHQDPLFVSGLCLWILTPPLLLSLSTSEEGDAPFAPPPFPLLVKCRFKSKIPIESALAIPWSTSENHCMPPSSGRIQWKYTRDCRIRSLTSSSLRQEQLVHRAYASSWAKERKTLAMGVAPTPAPRRTTTS